MFHLVLLIQCGFTVSGFFFTFQASYFHDRFLQKNLHTHTWISLSQWDDVLGNVMDEEMMLMMMMMVMVMVMMMMMTMMIMMMITIVIIDIIIIRMVMMVMLTGPGLSRTREK